MGLRFVFGASGAGKSEYLLRYAAALAESFAGIGSGRSSGETTGNILYLVPEQFTMQTQKDLVLRSSSGGIMNIDVLSFGRLSHRVFEEVGGSSRAVLDDLGKDLLLRRVASQHEKDLSVLGGSLSRIGMIAEIKSVLSEFMQYGITPEQTDELIRYANERGQGALRERLKDLKLLYHLFLQEEKERFITSEETLDLLSEAIPSSRLVRGSTVIFDGFTGFTPVQNRVVTALMQTAGEVIVSLTLSDDGGISAAEAEQRGSAGEEQALFYLTRKTVRDLCGLAKEAGVARGEDIYVSAGHGRTSQPELLHLEQHIFRHPLTSYTSTFRAEIPDGALTLFEASSIEEEVRQAFRLIRKMTREQGYAYRDIAVIAGDLAVYDDEIEREAARCHVPVYIDRTHAIRHNPLTESIRGALQILQDGYSYESVFHYLRSGLTGLTREEIDLLENYCLAHGIRGRRRWELPFAEFTEGSDDDSADSAADKNTRSRQTLLRSEAARQRFLSEIEPLRGEGRQTAAERTKRVYDFLVNLKAQEKLEASAERFAALGDAVREKEYSQIYREILELLDQIYELVGDEPISAKDYLELLETGFSEIRLGTLPQQVDRIMVGDTTRTRLAGVKVLFMLGVNDGAIPKGTSRGGLISDLDRELLKESGIELAATPREQMYIQRLYLYLNMTKASDRLIISYAKMEPDGSSLRPSYLIPMLQRMFPELSVEIPERSPAEQQLLDPEDARDYLGMQLRRYADGTLTEPRGLFTVYGAVTAEDIGAGLLARESGEGVRQSAAQAGVFARRLREAAFLRYEARTVEEDLSLRLYGRTITSSVSRMETEAQCMLRYFLQYGLLLREREEFSFRAADAGTVMHASIERFSGLLREQGIDWRSYDEETAARLTEQALFETAQSYHDLLLYDSSRSRHQLRRMQRALLTTAMTLQRQLRQGHFEPAEYELSFGEDPEVRFDLGRGRALRLVGRIDRMDLCESEGKLLVKILDYKSGNRDLDPDRIRQGLQLQLMVYMQAALAYEALRHPGQEIIPAAMLYYRFYDPAVAGSGRELESEAALLKAQGEIRKLLRPKGMVNASEDILRELDTQMGRTSEVIPVGRTAKGDFTKATFALTTEEFRQLSGEAGEAIRQLACDAMDGHTQANPRMLDARTTACTYCPFKDVCGFDRRVPGYSYRKD